MKAKIWVFIWLVIGISGHHVQAQTRADSTVTKKKYQAKAPTTKPFGAEAFKASSNTTLRWLGMAGFFINSRGTTLMIDPLLNGFDMPLLINFPIAPKDVPRLDAVLVTHADNDHFSVPTNRDLKSVTRAYHSTIYVDSLSEKSNKIASGVGNCRCSGNNRGITGCPNGAIRRFQPKPRGIFIFELSLTHARIGVLVSMVSRR